MDLSEEIATFELTDTHLFVVLRNSTCRIYTLAEVIAESADKVPERTVGLNNKQCSEVLVMSYADPCKILFCLDGFGYLYVYGAGENDMDEQRLEKGQISNLVHVHDTVIAHRLNGTLTRL